MSDTTETMSSVLTMPSGSNTFGRTTRSTPPTTTQPSTPAPTPDPHEYEKTAFKVKLDNRDLDLLKDHIRLNKGMQIDQPPLFKAPINSTKPPKVPPRTNETSRIRAELRKYRLIQRCGELAKRFMGKESELFPDNKPLTPEQEQVLFNKAKHLTAEEINAEKYAAEIEYLRYMAERATTQTQFRTNRACDLRIKHNHGEPVISTTFQHYFTQYEKPPFHYARQYKSFPRWKLPPIDKKKEIWFYPIQDDEGIPLHALSKPPPKPDGLTIRQRARQPLKQHAKSSRPSNPHLATKRPPWNFYIPAGYMQGEHDDTQRKISNKK